ncbi:MAG: hypothetical protein MRECE_5c007 [Mycoplasmataceae bacterium CE_OT135]|nr:MAG: hypothetical protein MRECE_5c007 [Mycoplasmataceae bacterium CE_OT135]
MSKKRAKFKYGEFKKRKTRFTFEVSVKNCSDGSIQKNLKRYVELEIDWQGNEGIPSKENEIINFTDPQHIAEEQGYFDYKFVLKSLRLKKGWFKDKVVDWKLEPIHDEESIKITIAWGYNITPSQIRWGNLILTLSLVSLVLFFGREKSLEKIIYKK